MGANQSKNRRGPVKGGKDVLGGGSGDGKAVDPPQRNAEDPRVAAAEAAERRLKAQQQRGTNASNPKQGQLSAQAAKQNTKPGALPPANQKDDKLVWD